MPKRWRVFKMIEIKFIMKYVFILFKFLFYKKGEQLDITKSDFDMWKFTKFIGISILVTSLFVLGSKVIYLAKSNIKLKNQIEMCKCMPDKK